MLNENWVFLGAIIFVLGSAGYFLGTIKGTVKPNRVTWFLWALAPLIAFAGQIAEGVGFHQALLTLTVGVVPLMIFFASFLNKKSYWKLERLDYICGILSIIGLILWIVSGKGIVAILFAILADALAGVPTIVKSYNFPSTENGTLYLANAITALITLLTIKIWTLEYYAFAVYIFAICTLLFVLIQFKLGPKLSKAKNK